MRIRSPDSTLFVSEIQDATKIIFFSLNFYAYSLWKVHLHHFSKINSHKEVAKPCNSKVFLLFCLLIEGSGSVQINYGSGSKRPKNLRIRIWNTDGEVPYTERGWGGGGGGLAMPVCQKRRVGSSRGAPGRKSYVRVCFLVSGKGLAALTFNSNLVKILSHMKRCWLYYQHVENSPNWLNAILKRTGETRGGWPCCMIWASLIRYYEVRIRILLSPN